MCRMASNQGSARLWEQRQPNQVLGSSHWHGSLDAVSPSSRSNTKKYYVTMRHYSHQHKNTIQALAWSPNGNLVASASRDQTVRVFDIRAMKEFRVLKGHKKEVCCTSISQTPRTAHPTLTLFSTKPSPGTPFTRSSSPAAPKVPSSTGTSPAPNRPRSNPPSSPARRSPKHTTPTSGR